jgi:hypothetical protein
VDSYQKLTATLIQKDHPFPIDERMIKRHYDVDHSYPAYMRICDLLEWTRNNPPRDMPFSEGYKPRFNVVKFFVLIGLHIMIGLRINPRWFDFLGKKFTARTERLMDYYRKAYVSKKDIRNKVEQLKRYIG